jgi:putative hydrolase of the HAD superfamily
MILKQTETRIEAVLFDLDDTLHDSYGSIQRTAQRVAEELSEQCAIDAGLLADAYFSSGEEFWDRIRSGDLQSVGLRQWMRMRMMHAVGLDQEPELADRAIELFDRYFKEYTRLYPEASELLVGLRERGMKLGLVTNGLTDTHREKIALLKLEGMFDAVFIADEVGMAKPDPRFFLHACARLEARPDHTLMVGDHWERDVQGARKAGLLALWFNPRGAVIWEKRTPSEEMVRDFQELKRLLV